MSFQAEVSNLAFRLKPRDGQYSVEKLAELALVENGHSFGLTEASTISKYRKALYNRILSTEDARVRRGAVQAFKSAQSGDLRLEWTKCKQSPAHRRLLELRACCARWLDPLNDRQYELASGHAMQRLGAERVLVTPHGNEWGIDFLAVVPAFSKSPLLVNAKRGLRIVGQAKKYASAVPRTEVQSFNDTLTSVRNNRAELLDIIPPWFRGSDTPIVGCFIGHKGFQSGARTLGNQAGLMLFDTLDLAELVALPRSFDWDATDKDVETQLWAGSDQLEA